MVYDLLFTVLVLVLSDPSFGESSADGGPLVDPIG
jgi:hypothetical protein